MLYTCVLCSRIREHEKIVSGLKVSGIKEMSKYLEIWFSVLKIPQHLKKNGLHILLLQYKVINRDKL